MIIKTKLTIPSQSYFIKDPITQDSSIFTENLKPGEMRIYNAFKNFQFFITCIQDNQIIIDINAIEEQKLKEIIKELNIIPLTEGHHTALNFEYTITLTKTDCDKLLMYLKLIGEI